MTRRLLAAVLVGIVAALVSVTPAMADPVRDAQWHLQTLDIAAAHDITKGEGVVVATIDSGVDARHPDLLGSILPGHDLTGPGDGRTDTDGHGTGTVGIIVAHGRALGVAPAAQIIPIRDGTVDDLSFMGNVDTAIDWAVGHGADVICMAEGGPTGSTEDADAVRRAVAADVVIVAAAGNVPRSRGVQYPAAYPGVVAVAGVDQDNRHAAVSVSGPEVVIAAPAVEVLSTDIRTAGHTGYKKGTGTSDAAAIVAGAAALVRAKFPELSAAEVVHRLTATADDKGPPGRDPDYGYGIVNIVKALTADVPPRPSLTPTATPATTRAASPISEGLPTIALVGIALLVMLTAGGVLIALRTRA